MKIKPLLIFILFFVASLSFAHANGYTYMFNYFSEDEICSLSAEKQNSLVDKLFVYVQTSKDNTDKNYFYTPSFEKFYKLPKPKGGGIGSVMRDKNVFKKDTWLTFCINNKTKNNAWLLSSTGSGLKPNKIVMFMQNGDLRIIDKTELMRDRLISSIADITSFPLNIPVMQKAIIYIELEDASVLGPDLVISNTAVFSKKLESIITTSGFLLGFIIAMCIVNFYLSTIAYYSVWVSLGKKRKLAFSFQIVFSCLSILSVFCSNWSGGVSALTENKHIFLYVASIYSFILALLIDMISYWFTHTGSKQKIGVTLRGITTAIFAISTFSINSLVYAFVPSFIISFYLLFGTIKKFIIISHCSKAYITEKEAIKRQQEIIITKSKGLITSTAIALNSPICGLSAVLDDIEEQLSKTKKLQDKSLESNIVLARTETTKLTVLISTLLAHIGYETSEPVSEEFNLASIIHSVVNHIKIVSLGKEIELIQDVPGLLMQSDLKLVSQLVYNAIFRAVSGNGTKHVNIRAEGTDDKIKIIITDDGDTGLIYKNKTPSISDISYIAIISMVEKLNGTFDYIRRNKENAHIFVLNRYSSDFPSVFSSKENSSPLPVLEPKMNIEYFNKLVEEKNTNSSNRIILAGSDSVSLISTKQRLESYGQKVEITISAHKALSLILSDEEYSIVVMDVNMLDMNGFDFCTTLRKEKKYDLMPIILLLETGNLGEIAKVFSCGANDYLVKPISGIELASRILIHTDLSNSIKNELNQVSRMAEFEKYKTLASLSAGVAHEISTPNNSVLRNVPMLKEIWDKLADIMKDLAEKNEEYYIGGFTYEDLTTEIPEILNDLYMGAQDIKRIVEGLKDYARTPSSSTELKQVDINDTIRYALRLLKHTIIVSTENFTENLYETPIFVVADRLKVTQIVVNVLENALQALPDRKCAVKVCTEKEVTDKGTFCIIKIIDNGIGMSEETRKRVFDPFFTTKRSRGGSGLGLSIVSGLVNEIGGKIFIDSELEKGTIVTISIPAIEIDEN